MKVKVCPLLTSHLLTGWTLRYKQVLSQTRPLSVWWRFKASFGWDLWSEWPLDLLTSHDALSSSSPTVSFHVPPSVLALCAVLQVNSDGGRIHCCGPACLTLCRERPVTETYWKNWSDQWAVLHLMLFQVMADSEAHYTSVLLRKQMSCWHFKFRNRKLCLWLS